MNGMQELQEPMVLLLHARQVLQRYEATLGMYDKPGVCYGQSSGGVTKIETALRNSCATTIVYYEGHL
jgi:hypothetical protein